MACIGCGRGFHEECEFHSCEECHPDYNEETVLSFKRSYSNNGKGAAIKDPEDVTDRHSTGRKRAALLWPIFEDKPCSWRGKKNCGGGLHPIIGCFDGMQRHRHHGPVKDTLRNEPGNVHTICAKCHNRWHSANDAVYDEEVYNTLPHAPEPATEIEVLASDAKWKMKK